MTHREKEALLAYIESQLMTLCQSLEPHIDSDAVGTLYEEAYDLLYDLETTVQSQVELQRAEFVAYKNNLKR